MAQSSFFSSNPQSENNFTLDYNPTILDVTTPTVSKLQAKQTNIAKNIQKKVQEVKLKALDKSAFTGLYDADSPYYSGIAGKNTARIGDPYGNYAQADELKVNGQLNESGVNERIRSDNFLMGVGSDTEDANLDPQYYNQYKQAMNQSLVEEADQGNITLQGVLGHTGHYGRQVLDVQREGQSLNEDLQSRVGTVSNPGFAAPGVGQQPSNVDNSVLDEIIAGGSVGGNTFVENTAKGVAAGGLGLAADLGELFNAGFEAIGEATGYEELEAYGKQNQEILKTARDEGRWNELTGYDSSRVEEYGDKVADLVEAGEYVDAAVALFDKRAVTAFGNSLPMMFAMTNPVGLGTVIAQNANKALNDISDDATDDDKLTTVAISVLATALDRIGDKAVLGSFDKLAGGILNKLPDAVQKNVLYKLGNTMTQFIGKSGFEGLTEGAQSILEGKASDLDKQRWGITDKEKREGLVGAAIGTGAGGVPAAVSTIADTSGITLDLANEGRKALSAKIDGIGKSQEAKAIEKTIKESTQELDRTIQVVDAAIDKAPIDKLPQALEKLDDLARQAEETKQPALYKKVETARKKVIQKLNDVELTEDITLGSKEDAETFIEEAFSLSIDANGEILTKNIAKIAKAHNISETEVKAIKDRAMVELEATKGARGYLTYGRQLQRLQKDPEGNSKAIDAVHTNLSRFESSQLDRLSRLNTAVKTIEAAIKSGTSDKRTKVNYAGSGSWNIDVVNGKIDDRTLKTIKDVESNIAGIRTVMGKYGLTTKEDGYYLRDELGDNKGKKGGLGHFVKSSVGKKLQEKMGNGETIHTHYRSGRKKGSLEHQAATYMAQHKYVEVDKDNVITIGTGRWVPKANATTKEPVKKPVSTDMNKLEAEISTLDEEIVDAGGQPTKAQQDQLDLLHKQIVDLEADPEYISNSAETITELTEEVKHIEEEIKLLEATDDNTELIAKLDLQLKAAKGQVAHVKEANVAVTLLENSNSTDMGALKGPNSTFEQELNINEILEVTKNPTSLLASVFVSDIGKKTVAIANATRKRIKASVMKMYDAAEKTYKHSKEEYAVSDGPSRALLYDKDGVIHPNVAAAIGIASAEYMALQSQQLGERTKKDIAQMVDKQEGQISNDIVAYFKDKGMYSKNVAADLGSATLKHLGLKITKNVPEEIYAKLVADLGQVGILTLIEEGNVEFTPNVDLKTHNAMLGLGKVMDSKDKTVSMVRFTEDGKQNRSTYIDKYEGLQEETHVESEFIKEPTKKPTKHSDHNIRNNDVTEQSETAKEVLDKFRNTKYVEVSGVKEWLKDNYDVALGHLGFVVDTTNMSYNSSESAKAKNDEIVRSLDGLLDNELNEMYFDWFYSKNGRYMMDTNTVNPQTDKLHRFAIVPKAHNVVISTDEHRSLFNTAIAQAFGMATDKKSTEEIQTFAKELIKIGPESLEKMLHTGKFADGVEVEHLSHYLQGIEALKSYEADKPFRTNLSMESDAVTSGFGIKLMQFPVIKNLYSWLSKTGIFTDKTVESMNDEVSKDGFDDSYQTLAKEISADKVDKEAEYFVSTDKNVGAMKEFLKALPTVGEDGKVSSELRTMFKDPFMTFNYSRGLGSISKGLGGILADQLIDEMIEGKHLTLLAKLQKTYGDNLITRFKNEDPVRIKPTKKSKQSADLYNYLSRMGSYSYGSLVGETLGTNFKEFVALNTDMNHAFSAMFQIYKTEYDKAVTSIEENAKRGITTEEKLKVIQSLRNVFPLIKGPFSDTELVDTIAIMSNKKGTPDYKYGSPRTLLTDGKQKVINSKIRELEESISGGSVIPIHFIDGALMGDTALQTDGLVSIHDAIIPPLTATIPTVKAYNKSMVHTNKNYSVLQALEDSLNRLNKDNADTEVELKAGISTEKVPFSEVVSRIAAQNVLVKQGRKELFNKNMDVVHMSAVPGSKYTYTPEVAESKVETQYNDEQKKALVKHLSKSGFKKLFKANNIDLKDC